MLGQIPFQRLKESIVVRMHGKYVAELVRTWNLGLTSCCYTYALERRAHQKEKKRERENMTIVAEDSIYILYATGFPLFCFIGRPSRDTRAGEFFFHLKPWAVAPTHPLRSLAYLGDLVGA